MAVPRLTELALSVCSRVLRVEEVISSYLNAISKLSTLPDGNIPMQKVRCVSYTGR